MISEGNQKCDVKGYEYQQYSVITLPVLCIDNETFTYKISYFKSSELSDFYSNFACWKMSSILVFQWPYY